MQPFNVYVTVYGVVLVGLTVMPGVVCPLLHANVPPPTEGVAVRVADCPLQIITSFTLTVGLGLTVTVPVAGLLMQPFNV